MTDPGRSRGRSTRRRAGLVGCAALLSGAVWAGCTVTQENYDTLSFWFDGVPRPWDGGDGGGNIRTSPDYTIHPPFAEDRCVECHAGRFNPKAADSSICLKCHEEIPSSQPRMHGPVVTVACLWCHSPHESPYRALLKDKPRTICSNCHAPGMLGTAKTPEHQPDSEVSCLECHYGHGGTVRYFLRQEGGGIAPPQAPHPVPEDPTDEPDPDQAPSETEREP